MKRTPLLVRHGRGARERVPAIDAPAQDEGGVSGGLANRFGAFAATLRADVLCVIRGSRWHEEVHLSLAPIRGRCAKRI
jgi:hypothetical protein